MESIPTCACAKGKGMASFEGVRLNLLDPSLGMSGVAANRRGVASLRKERDFGLVGLVSLPEEKWRACSVATGKG